MIARQSESDPEAREFFAAEAFKGGRIKKTFLVEWEQDIREFLENDDRYKTVLEEARRNAREIAIADFMTKVKSKLRLDLDGHS